jgi:heterodisulfide reductase subunit A
VEGRAGDFSVTLKETPRYIIEDLCTGCGTCVEYCPVEYPDPFNQEISENKAIHVYFSQAIPLVAYVDPESCLYLKEDKCDICRGVCQADAIDFRQVPKKIEVKVGAVILACGIEPFDPSVKEEYGFGRYANVVTSMDFERLLSSTGPYEGEVLRNSDR